MSEETHTSERERRDERIARTVVKVLACIAVVWAVAIFLWSTKS